MNLVVNFDGIIDVVVRLFFVGVFDYVDIVIDDFYVICGKVGDDMYEGFIYDNSVYCWFVEIFFDKMEDCIFIVSWDGV